MFNYALNALREAFDTSLKFTLQDIPDFPWEDYQEQLAEYNEAERWFRGLALDDQPEAKGKSVDLYPMRINPLIATCMKHAFALFGEVEDDGRPLVHPKILPDDIKNKSQKEAAEFAENRLNHLWWENSGRAILYENALLSQIYGGCVFKVTYAPWLEKSRVTPLRIERINPKHFIGYPDGSDLYRLSVGWIVKPIDRSEAVRLGYSPDEDENEFWYIEKWTPEASTVMVNKKPVTRRVRIFGSDKEYPLGGENPYGFVPMVYIPHVRAGDFRGINAYNHLVGLVKAYNRRWGDFEDAVNDDSHPIIATRNIQGSIQVKRVSNWLDVIDLGMVTSLVGGEPEPDMFEVNKPRASASMKDLVEGIYNQYRRDAFIPAVSEGEDEGSQRSGMTLAMRFWPLGQHAITERYFWTCGLDILQPMILKVMQTQKLRGITEAHTGMRMKQRWAPLLPRDREADVQEWVQRATAMLGSIDHLLELTGDVEDIDEEKERIIAWLKQVAEVEAKIQTENQLKLQEQQLEGQKELAEKQGENQMMNTQLQGQNQLKVASAKPKGATPPPKKAR